MNKCVICGSPCDSKNIGDDFSVNCTSCGDYKITMEAKQFFKRNNLSPRQKANISGWLFENQIFEIASEKMDWLLAIPTPSFNERADKLILYLEKETRYAGEYVPEDSLRFSYGWCVNDFEFKEILRYLESVSRIEGNPDSFGYKIMPDGWAHIETLKRLGADSKQGFVAMWFDPEMQIVYDEAIAKGILDAGFKPHRVDQREHNDKIDDEIIAQIRRSHFVVADFTEHRGGVYFEAGFAKGLRLEVFWTCRKDQIKELHFDIRQYNCIP